MEDLDWPVADYQRVVAVIRPIWNSGTWLYNTQTVYLRSAEATDNDDYRDFQVPLSERQLDHLYGLRVSRQIDSELRRHLEFSRSPTRVAQ